MSILGQQASGAQQHGAPGEWLISLVLAGLGLFAVVVAARVGVFRRGSIAGPPRVGEREPLGAMVVVLGMAVLLLIMAQVFCVTAVGGRSATTAPATTQATTQSVVQAAPTVQAAMSPGQMALAASVPPLVAFGFMVLANRTIRVNGLMELGFVKEGIGPGVKAGLVGSLIAVPLVFLSSIVTEFVWRSVHYSHPSEHELLTVLGESGSRLLGLVLIAAAVVVAPLFEEMLFRGHLQTLLTYAWVRLGRGPAAGRGFEVVVPEAGFGAPVPLPEERRDPAVWMRWASVVLTSVLFGLVHPAWSIPPIIVLSICLGYAYERTGNLWTTITMHAVFNGVSTMLFLWVVR